MEETISAIATAQGEGGIGIVRISGEEALPILKKLFDPMHGLLDPDGKRDQFTFENRKLHFGSIRDPREGIQVDEVLAVYMRAPHTYTREDVVEIHCHGSIVSLRRILELTLRYGARLAEQGEFTKRAFLNGRIDLSQAEAVIDLIRSKTDRSHAQALSQLEGRLSARIGQIRDKILKLLSHIIVNIDYPDADIEEITYHRITIELKTILSELDQLIQGSEAGRLIREGIRVVILGRPNVGKSSLMNALLREDRAIVTDLPGTTRDTIEERISIRGIPVLLIDTAGIRETDHPVERIGIQKTWEQSYQADLVLFVLDGANPLTKEDLQLMEEVKEQGRRTIVLINKVDLGQVLAPETVKQQLPDAQIILTSMIREQGILELEHAVEQLVHTGGMRQEESLLVANVRHIDLLVQSREALNDASKMVQAQEALDFIEMDIRQAWERLGEIIGDTVSEDIVDEIFSRFCLGK